MPGLINQSSHCPLPLTASEVTSCVSGYALGMTASLTYCNPQAQPCKGLFVFPLDEGTTVVGFEAVICQRAVTVQIKDKAKIDDAYFDSVSLPNGRAQDGGGRIAMDEDLERIAFVANLGTIPPLESVSIFISTSSELQTLPSGAVRVLLPAVCVPRVPQPSLQSASSLSSHLQRTDKQCCASGSPELGSRLCLAQLLQSEATNPSEYEFSFHLEIRGPCLLAGVESPTHEIRADADPSARSAKSIVITLANRHTFDRPVEILIHPSEPHMPHILMEEGDMTPAEYEQHLKGKNDFIKGTKKDPSAEKKTEIIRKRLHKDIPHHPVVMLNFCPELGSAPVDLQKAPREFIFLVDCSGSSSSITRAKDALLVALKSLMPACLFNIIAFSSTFKILFPASRTYCEESLAVACENIRRMRADAGSPNILSPLKWIVRQPIRRGHPRLLFLLTHGAVDNAGMVLELLRNHACSTRCYSFGVGPHACRRLVQGVAAVSRGIAEFLVEGERLQPKVIRSLKKAMAPVLSDVSVEWVFPESTEVLVSPISSSCLFPGDRLVGYGIICDTSLYISKPRADKRRRYSTMRSQESGSSVFFHSQEEGTGAESWSYPEGCSTPDQLAVGRDPSGESDTDADAKASCRRRAFSANQISDRQPLRKEPTASDPGSAPLRNPLRKTQLQDLQQLSPELQPVHFQPFAASPRISTTRICGAGARRPSLLQRSNASSCHRPASPPVPDAAVGWGSGLLDANLQSSSDSRSPGEPEAAQHPSFTFETETSSDWEPQDWDSGATRGSPRSPRSSCKAVVKGLRGGEPVQWEIAFDLPALLRERDRQEEGEEEDVWSETFHQLAARAVIRDLELLAERERDIEHGSGRRYQLNAVHTSKACNVISKYTAFVPVELSSGTYLPPVIEYSHTGASSKQGGHRSLSSGRRRCRGLSSAGPLSPCGQNGDDGFHGMDTDEPKLSPCSTPLSSSWKRCRIPEAPFQSLSASSARSPKSIEGIFAARLTLQKTRLLTRAAKGFMSKSPGRTSEASSESDSESADYLPLVSLQLACGAFLMNSAFCEAVSIPMEKLRWTSPFSCHRLALSPSGSSSTKKPEQHGSPVHGQQLLVPNGSSAWDTGGATESISEALKAESELSPPAIAIRRSSSPQSAPAPQWDANISEADGADIQTLLLDIELQKQTEPEGMLWATAVALAWLEHSSASHFTEWELVAAKASLWLGEQDFPQGCSLAAVKSAAQQLFVLLRHWDENLEFNLLCYNPGSV
ncbi:von Willebrand factor A domain-containing protein 5B1 [Numida meleagris]|uniref:von Willebrand factor A domain-containing protein 5B1 n=1 Tax=Numida meleagris TaxID=8996 RepID=UPI000B3DC91B|nr:von Willebrand factor A domain-containing protein 5B1 [Numida meleagris]XP_021272920.1 von Willebrand factor A domain-containing protein 5B1 [Numida meleagris]